MNRPALARRGALIAALAVPPVVAPRAVEAQRAARADSAAVVAVVEAVRGAGPLLCELAARSVESRWGWGGWDVRAPHAVTVRTALEAVRVEAASAAVPALAAALADADPCVRRLAAPLLGRVDHPSVPVALRSALQDARAETREAAALAMGFAEDPALIPPLLAGLLDRAAAVRAASAWALGMIEDERAVGALVRVLREDPEPGVRAAAAWALGEIEG